MRQIALGLLLLVATGCGPTVMKITMNADNNSGQKGFAEITDRGAKGISVTVETNTPEYTEVPQNAHIHTGNCGEVGEIVSGLTPLEALKEKPGRYGSTTELATLLATFKTGEWLINVHDPRDKLIYVSCGEIPRP